MLLVCFHGWSFCTGHSICLLFPGKDHLSHSQHPLLPVDLCVWLMLQEHFFIYYGIYFWWWDFKGVLFNIPKRGNLTANFLIFLLLKSFFPHFSRCSLGHGYENVLYMYPLGLESTTLHFGWVRFSVVVFICCKEQFSWWRVMTVPIIENKNKCL